MRTKSKDFVLVESGAVHALARQSVVGFASSRAKFECEVLYYVILSERSESKDLVLVESGGVHAFARLGSASLAR